MALAYWNTVRMPFKLCGWWKQRHNRDHHRSKHYYWWKQRHNHDHRSKHYATNDLYLNRTGLPNVQMLQRPRFGLLREERMVGNMPD
jgi:hypothetical protein